MDKIKKEKMILACIEKFGMTPDSAEFFIQEFPNTAYVALLNAKGRSVKVKHYGKLHNSDSNS